MGTSPPSYNVVMMEGMQKWNLPQEFRQAIESFIQRPVTPPANPYRYLKRCGLIHISGYYSTGALKKKSAIG